MVVLRQRNLAIASGISGDPYSEDEIVDIPKTDQTCPGAAGLAGEFAMGAISDTGDGTKELVRKAVFRIVIDEDPDLLLRVPLRAGPNREAPIA